MDEVHFRNTSVVYSPSELSIICSFWTCIGDNDDDRVEIITGQQWLFLWCTESGTCPITKSQMANGYEYGTAWQTGRCTASFTRIPSSAEKERALRWRHNEGDSVSTHQPYYCLLSRLFERRSKKTSKLCVTGLCAGNSPGTDEVPAQMSSNAENVSICWRHHGLIKLCR